MKRGNIFLSLFLVSILFISGCAELAPKNKTYDTVIRALPPVHASMDQVNWEKTTSTLTFGNSLNAQMWLFGHCANMAGISGDNVLKSLTAYNNWRIENGLTYIKDTIQFCQNENLVNLIDFTLEKSRVNGKYSRETLIEWIFIKKMMSDTFSNTICNIQGVDDFYRSTKDDGIDPLPSFCTGMGYWAVGLTYVE